LCFVTERVVGVFVAFFVPLQLIQAYNTVKTIGRSTPVSNLVGFSTTIINLSVVTLHYPTLPQSGLTYLGLHTYTTSADCAA
jgi:hypothetical protein